MKSILLSCLTLISLSAFAQEEVNPNHYSRNSLEPGLEPFYHGVASGDPLSDAVIIWTRITLNSTDPVDVNWRMATDTLFTNVVASGTATTDSTDDWTVKVDVTGLSSDSWYYYDFEYNGDHSLIGRTRTAPTGGVDHLRFGVVSCQSYENGYYHAYREMVNRNDMDCILHLGDYIYEYATGGLSAGMPDRLVEPANEIISLSDYRTRYSHYRLDPDLRDAHQQYPFICVWDDHETANNSYSDGAENHTEGAEGFWVDRKAYGIQANMEWLPIRQPDPNDPEREYRDFNFGDLADLNMLDTRLYNRDEQGAGNDNERNLLGYEQRQWLYDNLSSSTSKWKLLGQQVMVAPLTAFGIPVNDDQWDGYPAERDSLYDHLTSNNIDNMVVLTGDIHTSWANDLPGDNYVASTGAGSVGVEFVVTSISTTSSPVNFGVALIQAVNPHIKFADLAQKGYLVLDLTEDAAQSDWYYVSSITSPTYTSSWGAGWKTNDGDNHLTQASTEAPAGVYPPLAPVFNPNSNVGIYEQMNEPVIVSAYPNPFVEKFVVQFNLFERENIHVKLTDVSGKIVLTKAFGQMPNGLHYLEVNVPSQLASGIYIFTLQSGENVINRRMSKL
ncbi:MAG: alkaline phosphatase D family protein [Flavobacteriales bacterium]|nr:alkaline phosphatase D family protein [Flavobacteriales bacterium]